MGRFLLGFAVGVAIGSAVVVLTSPRSSVTFRAEIGDTLQGALDAARRASDSQQQTMWAEFRARLSTGQ